MNETDVRDAIWDLIISPGADIRTHALVDGLAGIRNQLIRTFGEVDGLILFNIWVNKWIRPVDPDFVNMYTYWTFKMPTEIDEYDRSKNPYVYVLATTQRLGVRATKSTIRNFV